MFNDVIFIDGTTLPAMPGARRRAAGPAAWSTIIAITRCGKNGTITRLTGTAGSTTAPGPARSGRHAARSGAVALGCGW